MFVLIRRGAREPLQTFLGIELSPVSLEDDGRAPDDEVVVVVCGRLAYVCGRGRHRCGGEAEREGQACCLWDLVSLVGWMFFKSKRCGSGGYCNRLAKSTLSSPSFLAWSLRRAGTSLCGCKRRESAGEEGRPSSYDPPVAVPPCLSFRSQDEEEEA